MSLKGRHVVILGMGATALRKADYIEQVCPDGCEVWSLNNAYAFFPNLAKAKRFTRFFELHEFGYLKTWKAGENERGEPIDHFRTLDSLGCPVYVTQPLPMVRNQVQYPYGDVFESSGGLLYTLGSPTLMLALAVHEHKTGQTIERIDSYGIDTMDERHRQQRAPWAVWTHSALWSGITMGGTSMAYVSEIDQDEGMKNLGPYVSEILREHQAAKKPNTTPPADATASTQGVST